MCDYSLQNVKSRSAKVGDKLSTRNFWDGYPWVRRARRCHDSGVRPSGIGACVLPGGRLYSIRFPRLRCNAQNGLADGDLPAGQ
jgi:hypothetical protein